jgi:hypothetical protein
LQAQTQADTAAQSPILETLDGLNVTPLLRRVVIVLCGVPLAYVASAWLRRWVAGLMSPQAGLVAGRFVAISAMASVVGTVTACPIRMISRAPGRPVCPTAYPKRRNMMAPRIVPMLARNTGPVPKPWPRVGASTSAVSVILFGCRC